MPLRIRDISTWVEVDGRELQQHFSYNPDKRTAECWIPSEEGKAFAVCWRNLDRGSDTGTRLVIDGMNIKGTHLYPFLKKPGNGIRIDTHKQTGVQTSLATERPFIFEKHSSISDRCSVPSGNEAARQTPVTNLGGDKLGMITVIVSELASRDKSRAVEMRTAVPGWLPGQAANAFEAQINGSEHVVRLGENKDTAACSYRQRYHRVRDIATFIFRYRPAEVLRSMYSGDLVPSLPMSIPVRIPPTPDWLKTVSSDSWGRSGHEMEEEKRSSRSRLLKKKKKWG
ncbi:hypothetical protein FA15DRAFT_170953 [Coprinopsis marcescibilis]|uniref:DUF7918 domain-containing protein n=1 Tax=Coprinopsis marcescibilis TaxID=230819 RepID=A0A5C3L3W6_COPMA|nr:hypothetical protein FA15DRAFT_170953 [Coprinopsis marcescibilis]